MWTNIYNLADGHAWQSPDSAQSKIVDRLGTIYASAATASFQDLEAEFREAFFDVTNQLTAASDFDTLLSPTASYSIDVVAALAAERKWSVLVVEPCFGHIPKILQRRGANLFCLDEARLVGDDLPTVFSRQNVQALFLCTPNSPSGLELDVGTLTTIASACKARDVVLLIDRAYGAFSQNPWDHYELLKQTGTEFIAIEDTGKTWPTLDLKVGLAVTDSSTRDDLKRIQDEMLLHVSPFVLAFLKEFMLDSRHRGLGETAAIVAANRRALRKALDGSPLRPVTRSAISAEWLHITSATESSLSVVERAKSCGVIILPGEFFFWKHPELGERFVRVALMRDPEYFCRACGQLAAAFSN